jgi:hypothetical protein
MIGKHSDVITSTIDAYLGTEDIEETELNIIVQLDFDDESNVFSIDYALCSQKEETMEIDTGFSYNNLAVAWENYLDEITELHQRYEEAEIKNAHPEQYKGGKIGGNPVMSIRDADGGL